MMNIKIIILLLFISVFGYSQSKTLTGLLASQGSTTSESEEEYHTNYDYILTQSTDDGDTISLATANSTNFSADDNIDIFGNITGTLTITESGSSGHPITIRSHSTTTKYKVYNSEPVTGFIKRGNSNLYVKYLTSDVTQFFENGERKQLARSPNSGYFDITGVGSTTVFTSTDLDGGIDYTDGSWVGRTSAYLLFSKTISTSTSQTITLSSAPYDGGLGTGEGFFVCDKLELLDQAGEWYYNSTNDSLYFWASDSDDPDNYSIRASTTDYGFVISGDYVTIEDIKIVHSSIYGANVTGDYVEFDNVDFIYPDLAGMNVASTGDYLTVNDCYIVGANANAITISAGNTTITNTTIDSIGQLDLINKTLFDSRDNNCTAIYQRNGNTLTVTNCDFNNIGYDGINFQATNSIIKYNYINGACQVLDDGAGIYTYNGSGYVNPGSEGTVIDSNIIVRVYGALEGKASTSRVGYGIYLDDYIHDVDVLNNTISQCGGGIYFHQNGLVTGQYNTIFDCMLGIRITATTQDDIDIDNNIIYLTDREEDFVWWLTTNNHQHMVFNWDAYCTIDYNTFVSHYIASPFSHGGSDRDFATWKSLTGQDANSTMDASAFTTEQDTIVYNPSSSSVTYTISGTTNITGIDATNYGTSKDTAIAKYESAIFTADGEMTITEN